MKAFGDDGEILEAEFDVEETEAGFDVVLHSNGGVSRGKPAHNPDYIAGLETILLRLKSRDATLDGAWVDSKEVAELERSKRTVTLQALEFPVRLSDVPDIGEFRLEIRRSVALIGGRGDGAPGTGNKKLRLGLSFAARPSLVEFEGAIRGTPGVRRPSRYDPLKVWLQSVRGDTARLSLDEIGTMVGGLGSEPLHHRFWSTISGRDVTRPQQRAWSDAGFKATLNQPRREVTFRRLGGPATPVAATGYWVASGAPTATEVLEPQQDVRQWIVEADQALQLAVGHVVAVVSSQRFSVAGADGTADQDTRGVWIVEAPDLERGTEAAGDLAGTVELVVRRLASFGTGAPIDTQGPASTEPEASTARRLWLALPEDDFDSVLRAWGTGLEQLSISTGSPDLNDRTTRSELWSRTRHAAPIVRERLSRYVERGQIGAMVKSANLYSCQICRALGRDWDGFFKPDGPPYVEAHHVVPVATLDDDVLSARNVITVCPNHHRQLHFGGVQSIDLGEEFEFGIPGHPPVRVAKFKEVAEERT